MKRRITLIRHGKPKAKEDYSPFSIISGSEMGMFIRAWNSSELYQSGLEPIKVKDVISDGDVFICSELKRTSESFSRLGIKRFDTCKLLNEAQLPHGICKNVKLPLFAWLVILRILWRFGWSENSESYMEFKNRIKNAAEYLVNHESEAQHIVVMAHGFVNRHLNAELVKRNWKLVLKEGGNSFWSFLTYENI
ncbi:Phosphoglycerate mutase [Chitinispirillum alkaliphilum]|nr:Phosphoglycerate mutase [Chitinispirillum alkaliphilum]